MSCQNRYPQYGSNCDPCPMKDQCSLKSFCDPGIANSCGNRPIIDPLAPKISVTTWKVNYLTSDVAGSTPNFDPIMSNPWGIVIFDNEIFIANGATDAITNYDLFGVKIIGRISVRSAVHNSSFPTDIIVNCGNSFNISNGITERSPRFLTCTEQGTVHAYSPQINPNQSSVVLNMQLTGEVSSYTGIAVANNVLYLANFFQGHIDVFAGDYERLFGYNFVDGDSSDPIPIDYSPFNIVHIGPFLYVLWARRNPNVVFKELDGPGLGFVSVFGLDGSFIRRFTSRGVLNAPWAMIPAPCECGFPPGSFLIGNNGDGRINIFDANGGFVGPLLNQAGLPISIEGLRGLSPLYAEFNQIYFTAAPFEESGGVLGNIVKSQVASF